ncbi:MAG: DoxX family protein [Streptosporangiales bacterium]
MTTTDTIRAGHPARRRANIALWIVQGVTAVAVVGAGLATVGGAAQPVEIFEEIGAGEWFRYLTGALEVAGGLGLLIPRLCGLAGLALVGLWLGAIATHLLVISGNPAAAAVFLLLVAVIAYARRGRTVALVKGFIR